jgi:aspartokinase-like uncharacterized kinase
MLLKPATAPWVIKIGGSLLRTSKIRSWLPELGVSGSILVPGGGTLADGIRQLQDVLDFDDRLAHELAIRTMALNAHLLQGLDPALPAATTLEGLKVRVRRGQSVLWCPEPRADFLKDLPASWQVTSDSLAITLAAALGLRKILLIKSVTPTTGRESLATAVGAGLIDTETPKLLRASAMSLYWTGPEAYPGLVRGLEDPVSWFTQLVP